MTLRLSQVAPADAQIQWGHPIARGLLFCVPRLAPGAVELVTRQPVSFSAAPIGVRPHGSRLTAYSNTRTISVPFTVAGRLNVGATIAVGVSEALTSGAAPTVLAVGRSGINALALQIGWSGGLPYVRGQRPESGGWFSVISGGSSLRPGVNNCAIAWATNRADRALVSVNGVVVQAGPNSYASRSPADTFYFQHATDAGGTNQDGLVTYGYIWNRSLGAAELTALHLDPFCFLRPRRRTFGYVASTFRAQVIAA